MSKVNLVFLKKKRLEKKLTLKQMSNILGFEKACTYYKYENGATSIKADMLPVLANILECEIEDFFCQSNC